MLERSRRQGNPTALDTRPTLYDDLDWYLDAFFFLANSRIEGGGILVSEIREYANLLGVENVLEFVQIVKLIDNLYITTVNKVKKDG